MGARHSGHCRPALRLLAGALLLLVIAAPVWAGHAPTAGGPPPTNPPPQPGPNCDPNNRQCCQTGGGGLHVDFWSGREFVTHNDLELPGLFPITIRRSYDNQAQYDSALGYGWALNYFVRLYEYADGSVILRRDCGVRRGFLLVGGAYQTPVGETGVLVKNGDSSWTYTEKGGEQLRFDAAGRLTALVSAAGPYLRFTYDTRGKLPLIGLSPYAVDTTPKEIAREHRLLQIEEIAAGGGVTGRFVNLTYDDGTGRLTGLSDNAGRSVAYEHDGVGNLTQVSLPEGGLLNYAYEDPRDAHNATTLTNSGCTSCGGFGYELTYDAQDRVIREQVGQNVMRITYAQAYVRTIVDEDVTDEQGSPLHTATTTYEFNALGNPTKITDALGHQKVFVYDANMNLTREERWENTGSLVLRYVEERTYDARGNVLTVTQAKGSPQQRITTFVYDSNGDVLSIRVPSVVDPLRNKVSSFTYDPRGNILTETEAGVLGGGAAYSYTTTYTYDANGRTTSVDGPRTDLSDVTTMTYDASGNLASITQPGGLTTLYVDYTATGQAQTVTDPNGHATTYTYDSLGRVKTAIMAGGTSSYVYTTTGKLASVTMPRLNTTTYSYDALDRLTSVRDALGNSINYIYDSAGNRLREEIKDPAGTLRKALSFSYDPLKRLARITNPDASFAEYGYTYAGHTNLLRDPRGNVTTQVYDPLGRLVSSTQPGSIITSHGYDAHDGLVSVTKADGDLTTYARDDQGRVYEEVSPDTGTARYGYDAAGNRVSRTDALGVVTTYRYDALKRLERIEFPSDPPVVYTYDSCPNGKGRLCQVQDQSGTTSYTFDAKGQMVQEIKVVGGTTYTTRYAYDANGNIETVTYPSGRRAGYVYDAADRVASVTTTPPGGSSQPVATAISHEPFGDVSGFTYGSGLPRTISHDQQYRPTRIQAGSLQDLTYGYDPNSNVTSITNAIEPAQSRAFGYDPLDRLTSAGNLAWTYDRVSNRLTQAAPEGASTYSYAPGTDRLVSVSGPNPISLAYDANGNAISQNGWTYSYNENGRLEQASSGATSVGYAYNAEGQRVTKTSGSQSTVFHYDLRGSLIAETGAGGSTTAEYLYLNGQPIAKAEGTALYFIQTDHLATPVSMTNTAGTKVWGRDARPFGDGEVIAGTASLNLRFPGQYRDQETGLDQNWNRDYASEFGRYLERDPVGLDAGLNLYTYADANPLKNTDPMGLWISPCRLPEVMACRSMCAAQGKVSRKCTVFYTPVATFVRCHCSDDTSKIGDCTPQQHAHLQNTVDFLCKGVGRFACRDIPGPDCCDNLLKQWAGVLACLAARQTINRVCFKGATHGDPEYDNANKKCMRLLRKYHCIPGT